MAGILVIDDYPDVLSSFEFFGEVHSVRVYTAKNGWDGIDTWEMNRVDIDLVFLDFQLPVDSTGALFNGDRVMRRLKELNPDIKVVMITSFDPRRTVDQAMEGSGVLEIVAKPVDWDTLKALLNKYAPEAFGSA
jgi:CheY-like chemotaxis protein